MRMVWDIFKGLIFLLLSFIVLIVGAVFGLIEYGLTALRFPFRWVRTNAAKLLEKMLGGRKKR